VLQDELRKRRRRKRRPASQDARVLAYVRVSTEEQADSGAGLDAQKSTILAEASRRGWEDRLDWVEDAGVSASTLNRPGMHAALERLSSGDASILVAARIDRLSRSILDFATLTDRAEREGWSLVAIDAGLDQTTAAGKMMAGVLSVFAAYERDLIAERTRRALASRKRLNMPVSGLQIPADIRARMAQLRLQGSTYQEIADTMNGEGIPTARHGRWHPSTVFNALKLVGEAPDDAAR
jgi:DNA invertase Pin-like site-specific DNA recombinase